MRLLSLSVHMAARAVSPRLPHENLLPGKKLGENALIPLPPTGFACAGSAIRMGSAILPTDQRRRGGERRVWICTP